MNTPEHIKSIVRLSTTRRDEKLAHDVNESDREYVQRYSQMARGVTGSNVAFANSATLLNRNRKRRSLGWYGVTAVALSIAVAFLAGQQFRRSSDKEYSSALAAANDQLQARLDDAVKERDEAASTINTLSGKLDSKTTLSSMAMKGLFKSIKDDRIANLRVVTRVRRVTLKPLTDVTNDNEPATGRPATVPAAGSAEVAETRGRRFLAELESALDKEIHESDPIEWLGASVDVATNAQDWSAIVRLAESRISDRIDELIEEGESQESNKGAHSWSIE